MNLSIFDQFPVIKLSDKLILRELKHTDANALKNILSHPSVSPYIPGDVIPSSITHALREVNFLKTLFNSGK